MTSFTLIMFGLPAAIIAAALMLAGTVSRRSRNRSPDSGEADR